MPVKVDKKKRGGALAMAVTLALAFFGHPSNEWILVLCAALSLSLIYAFSDYPTRGDDGFRRFVRWTFLVILCASTSSIWGWFWWQRITVSPARVSFEGYPNETFNFSVRNGRSDGVYDVQIPFPIGHGKHFEDKFSAKVAPNGDPPQRLYFDYNYCFGEKGDGDVQKILPNEREVLIVRITHLVPYGVGNFSITYTGGEKISTSAGEPSFANEPYSYSPMQGTLPAVRGDYRICKVVVKTDGLVGK